jgi:cellulose synthase/poly-beta-1,6-N-acetylglucosamine synthase-like glycosyltransferase
MGIILAVLAVVVGALGAGTALHLGSLALASLLYRPPRPKGAVVPVRFIVLVPAYNEELVIESTLAALMADKRDRDTVLVIADRCTDATAEIARRFGALVLERGPEEEPGRAAARQAGIDHALTLDWDAMVMVDADSIISPGFFDACEAAMATGAPALQARSEMIVGDRFIDHAAVAAFAMQGVTMPRGRDRLGLLVRLRGTGMVLRRDVVTRFQFRAPASEDLWYSLDMCLAGEIPRHVDGARLRSLNVSNWKDAGDQKVRYEAGRMSAAKEFVRPLLRKGSPAALEAAWFLSTPPFAVGAMLLVVATVLGFLSGTVVGWVFLVLLGVLSLSLVVALVEARASLRTWLGLAVAPWYLPWKLVVQLKALVSVQRRVERYGPTPRS